MSCAILQNNSDTVNQLIEKEWNIDRRNNHGETPLLLACKEGKSQLAAIFLEKGADITIQDYYGLLPLHAACQKGNITIVQLLLNYGADKYINKTIYIDRCDESALHIACHYKWIDIAQLLLESEADPNQIRNYNAISWQSGRPRADMKDSSKLPLHIAVSDPSPSHALIRCLVQYGANLLTTDSNGYSVYQRCRCSQTQVLLKQLLFNQIKTAIQDTFGNSHPLIFHEQVIDKIAQYTVDLDMPDMEH